MVRHVVAQAALEADVPVEVDERRDDRLAGGVDDHRAGRDVDGVPWPDRGDDAPGDQRRVLNGRRSIAGDQPCAGVDDGRRWRRRLWHRGPLCRPCGGATGSPPPSSAPSRSAAAHRAPPLPRGAGRIRVAGRRTTAPPLVSICPLVLRVHVARTGSAPLTTVLFWIPESGMRRCALSRCCPRTSWCWRSC